LITLAHKAKENSYSPYSSFKVGCALQSENDDIIIGCNMENSSYPNGVCAEKNAVAGAICRGKDKI